jgi:DNA-binding FadR family transcriptional regulator
MTNLVKPRKIVSTAGTTREFIRILKRMSGAGPADILAVRLIIEPQAAAAVVSSASGSDLKLIREAHENAVNAEDLSSFEHWDGELHSRIYAATRNELLISLNNLLGDIRTRPPWIRLKKRVITEDKRREYCGHHEEIVEAIARRNADAASDAMHLHISVIIEDLFPK